MSNKLQALATSKNIVLILIASIGLAIYSGIVWYNTIYTDETNVFWAAMETNLRTTSVTKVTESNNAPRSLSQYLDIDYAGELSVDTRVLIKSDNGDETVDLNTRGFAGLDYLRYSEITLEDKEQQDIAADGVGIWAVQEPSATVTPELLKDAMTGSLVLFGNLPHNERSIVMSGLKESYVIDKVTPVIIKERKLYEYEITINISEFTKVLAEYLDFLGETDSAEALRDQQETSSGTLPFKMLIDKRSRTVVETSTANGGAERYIGIGASRHLEAPKDVVTYEELQTKLSQ